MELKKYKLGELIDVTRGQSLSGEYYATEGKYIRLTCGNFDYNNNSFKENTSKENLFFTGTIKPEFIMKKGDIITPLTEQAIGLLGSTAIIPESDKYIQSQDVAKIICKENKLDHDFAYYLISSKLVKEQLSVAAQQTKIRHTSPDKIKDCTVWIPNIETQHRIAHVLSSLDRKISLNRSINAELERMAKEIYDYWFVQFDFPDEHGRPYKSSGGKMVYNPVLKREIPEGWEVVTIESVLNKISSGRRPGPIDKSLKKGIPSLGAECVDELGVFNYEKTPFVASEFQSMMTSGRIEDMDILIYKDGAYVGKTTLFQDCFPYEEAYVNEHVFLVNTKDKFLQYYLYFTLHQTTYFDVMQSLGKAKAAQPGLNQQDLKSIIIILPDKDVYTEFYKKIEHHLHLIFSNSLQSEELRQQRDSLLPLLMTGQVGVK